MNCQVGEIAIGKAAEQISSPGIHLIKKFIEIRSWGEPECDILLL